MSQPVMLPSEIVDVMITARDFEIDLLRKTLGNLIAAHQRARKAEDDFKRAGFSIDDESGNEEIWQQIQDEFEAAHVDLIRAENTAREALSESAKRFR